MPSTRFTRTIESYVYPPDSNPARRTTVTFEGDVYDRVLELGEKLGKGLSAVVNMLLRAGVEDALDWVEQTGFGFESRQGLTTLGQTALEEWLASDSQLQELSGEAATRYIATYARNLAQQPGYAYPEEAPAPGAGVAR